jgi:hypothetical protein
MKIHEFNTALKKKIKTDYKSCCLKSVMSEEAKALVPYNIAGKPIEPKFKEIQIKLENSPAGIYYIYCQQNYGSRGTPDIFAIRNGNPETLSEGSPVIHYLPNPTANKVEDNFLSRDEAYKNMQEITRLTIENEILKQKVSDLEAELEKEEPLNEGGAVKNWLSEIIPTVAPILDQYFSTKNREIDLKEKSFYNQQPQQQQKQRIRNPKPKRMWPNIHDENDLNDFLNDMEDLTPEQFNQVCEITKIEAPELHDIILKEFVITEEDDNQQEEEENN